MGEGMGEEGGGREGRLSDCGEELGVKLLQVICTAVLIDPVGCSGFEGTCRCSSAQSA